MQYHILIHYTYWLWYYFEAQWIGVRDKSVTRNPADAACGIRWIREIRMPEEENYLHRNEAAEAMGSMVI
jgi:hypothetical protein